LGAETARHNSRVAVVAAVEIPAGSTIRNIAVVLLTEIEVPRTSLVVQREATRFRIAKLVPGNRSAGRAGICPAIAPEEPAWAIEPAEIVSAADLAEQALAIGRAVVEQIALEAETFLAVVAETETRLAAVREVQVVTTDRAPALAAAGVHRVLVLAEEVVEVAADADRSPGYESKIKKESIGASYEIRIYCGKPEISIPHGDAGVALNAGKYQCSATCRKAFLD